MNKEEQVIDALTADVETEENKQQLKMERKLEKLRQKEVKKLEKKGKNSKKKKMVRHVGLHNKRVALFFGLFIASLTFGVYKNFTAVDTHTVQETKVIQEKLLSTNAVESFSRYFMNMYFTWQSDADSIRQRAAELEPLVSEELIRYIRDMLGEDIGTSSRVYMLDIWDIEKVAEQEYKVTYQVGQEISSAEAGSKKIEQSYGIQIHIDKKENMLITKLPVLTNIPVVSSYKPKTLVEQTSLDLKIKDSITEFVNDFFMVYPKSTEKDLKYYAVDGAMPILADESYALLRIDEVIITEATEENAKVSVKVVYESKATNTKQMYAYDLTLEKTDNWKITKMK